MIRPVRGAAPVAVVTLAALLAACGGGSAAKGTPTSGAATVIVAASPASGSPAAVRSPGGTVTAAATAGAPGSSAEVGGIIGVVSVSSGFIVIERRSGADVRKLLVDSRTVVRKAAGGTERLEDLKPSDRIVASGRLNDRGDALQADVITVQAVVPGAQPGG